MLQACAAAHGLRWISLRYFNAAGADPDGELGENHDPETHLIPLVLAVASGRLADISIFGTDYDTPDGTCIRDYIHVTDLAEAHLLALQALDSDKANTAYNLGTGSGYSVRQVIDMAAQITGRSIASTIAPRRAGDPPRLVAATDKARQALGWIPRYSDLKLSLPLRGAGNANATKPTARCHTCFRTASRPSFTKTFLRHPATKYFKKMLDNDQSCGLWFRGKISAT